MSSFPLLFIFTCHLACHLRIRETPLILLTLCPQGILQTKFTSNLLQSPLPPEFSHFITPRGKLLIIQNCSDFYRATIEIELFIRIIAGACCFAKHSLKTWTFQLNLEFSKTLIRWHKFLKVRRKCRNGEKLITRIYNLNGVLNNYYIYILHDH